MNHSLNDSFQSLLDDLSSSIDSSVSHLTDNQQGFAQDHQTNGLFDHHPLVETHQIDHFSQDHYWNDTSFHSAPEHSLTQDIDSLLNGSDSSDDSNNPNTTNFTMPTFQHHVHYHPPHEHFHTPSSSEHLENEHEKIHTYHAVHSAPDSYEVHHYHHLVGERKPIDMSGCGSPVLSNDTYGDTGSDSDYSGSGSDCVDANGDGQCDSGSGSSDSN